MAGMKRRDFIAAAGSTAVAWPLVAGAQQPERMRRIGVLMALAESEDTRTHIAKFRQELEKLGWSEGQNVRKGDLSP
jgi:putative tryptophan/tyrosine transport system substrate-binding protein